MAEAARKHPSAFEPALLVLNLLVAIWGAIIGLELISRVGVTPNTSIIGALLAILIARIPISVLRQFLDINRQNLVQTIISASTFAAANALFVPIGVVWLLGRPDLLVPMWLGATLAAFVDLTMLYWLFDSRIFPASKPWPPGIAIAETLLAAAEKGRKALHLLYGMIAGGAVTYFNIPGDIAGIMWIGNIFALTMFAIGLIIRGYSPQLIGIDISKTYIPHGIMIGAGIVAIIQIAIALLGRRKTSSGATMSEREGELTRTERDVRNALTRGLILYLIVALIVATMAGLYTQMSPEMFVWWIIYAAVAALIHELIVGLSAMHAGWFPAFATALMFLITALLMGFPPLAAAFFVGFNATTGPAFADLGYDLKTGWLIRGKGKDKAFEMDGRRQQYITDILAIIVATTIVGLFIKTYLVQNLVPPVDRVYVATIKAGTSAEVAKELLIWAIPGAILQAIGGPDRQLGILFATGLLIYNPMGGIAGLIAIAMRVAIIQKYKERGQEMLYIWGAGLIGGSALTSFTTSTLKLYKPK